MRDSFVNLERITRFVLLGCYIALGVLGTPGKNVLLDTLADNLTVQKTRAEHPTATKVYWTQHKHIGSTSSASLNAELTPLQCEAPTPHLSGRIAWLTPVSHTFGGPIAIIADRAPPHS